MTSLATVQLQPIAFRSIYDAPVIPKWIPIFARSTLFKLIDFMILDLVVANPINSLRSELGLAPVRHIFGSWAHSPQKTIGLFPAWFAALRLTGPRTPDCQVLFCMQQEGARLDSELARFLDSGPPPVHIYAWHRGETCRGVLRKFNSSCGPTRSRGDLA